MNRAERRRQKAAKPVASYGEAVAGLSAIARELAAVPERTAEGRGIARAIALIEEWQTRGKSPAAARAALLDGTVRLDLAKAHPELTAPTRAIACQMGCAWCCADVSPIAVTEAEVRAVAAATKGTADGRNWLPAACPALDPKTRVCQAYEERPLVCRGFYSTDAAACERHAAGGPNDPARFSTYQEIAFAVQTAALALARRSPPRYELRRALAGIRDGLSVAKALANARLTD